MMSSVSTAVTHGPPGSTEGVDAIMRRGGEGLRERMLATELYLERVAVQSGAAPLASN